MTRHRAQARLRATIAAVTLPLAILAACAEDEPEPNGPDSQTAEPSDPDSSGTTGKPVAPEPPAAMEKANVAGAKAFVEYYFTALNHAIESGDVRLLQRLSSASCGSCTNLEDLMVRLAESGADVSGGLYTVESVAFTQSKTENTKTFQGGGEVSTTRQEIEGSGVRGLDGRYPEGTSRYRFAVTVSEKAWRMSRWEVLSPRRP